MPSSLLALAPLIVQHVREVQRDLGRPIRVLDVGPGFGKYGLLLREYVDGFDGGKLATLDCIEAEHRYIDRFTWLEHIYDHVYFGDVCKWGQPVVTYDLVMLLDSIEHIEKSEAVALLGRIPGRVLISTPREFFQNPEHVAFPSEKHRSHWTPADFAHREEAFDVDAYERLACVLVRLAPDARLMRPQ